MRALIPLLLIAQGYTFGQAATYVGSAACRTCHPGVYSRWSKSLMANVVRDPKAHPDANLPDLSKLDRLVKFALNDIAFVYGRTLDARSAMDPVPSTLDFLLSRTS